MEHQLIFLIGGGGVTPACFLNTEIWNGSSWSENSDMIHMSIVVQGMGTTNDGVRNTGHDGTTPYYSRIPFLSLMFGMVQVLVQVLL